VTEPVATPLPAATIVLLRPGPDGAEVLLIHRPATMSFGAGLHVFPGGKVDDGDADPDLTERSARSANEASLALGENVPPIAALALHRAAIRELHEEAGVLLAGTDRLSPIAHWTTPAFMPRRFSTWFFVADLPPDAVPVFAPDEVAAHRWVTPCPRSSGGGRDPDVGADHECPPPIDRKRCDDRRGGPAADHPWTSRAAADR
jgi:8-oxo-dGTP pyrophosphatase MutT (NUDIX family)